MSEIPEAQPQENSSGATGSGWEICALLAACIILLTPFIYQWRVQSITLQSIPATAEFAGTAACKECHQD